MPVFVPKASAKPKPPRVTVAVVSQEQIKTAAISALLGNPTAVDGGGLVHLSMVGGSRCEVRVSGDEAVGHIDWKTREADAIAGVENIVTRFMSETGCGSLLACAFVYIAEAEGRTHLCLNTTDTSGGLWSRFGLKEVSSTNLDPKSAARTIKDVLALTAQVGQITIQKK